LVSGQVKEAETRETHLKNELRKHQIELPETNIVWLFPYSKLHSTLKINLNLNTISASLLNHASNYIHLLTENLNHEENV